MSGAPHHLVLKLPVMFFKFMEPVTMTSQDFFQRWKQLQTWVILYLEPTSALTISSDEFLLCSFDFWGVLYVRMYVYYDMYIHTYTLWLCRSTQEAQRIFPAKFPIEKEKSGAKVTVWCILYITTAHSSYSRGIQDGWLACPSPHLLAKSIYEKFRPPYFP